MLHIGIYENDPKCIKTLKQALEFYVVNRNTEFDITWFTDDKAADKVVKYVEHFHLVLVSEHAPSYQHFCNAVHKNNAKCRICLYRIDQVGKPCVSEPLWFVPENEFSNSNVAFNEALSKEIDVMIHEFQSMGNCLMIETRQLLYLIPVEDIEYLYSDLKYVNILKTGGEEIAVYKKLDYFEEKLISGFLRVHKSYIVNINRVNLIDKVNRMVIMDNREQIPISASRYNDVASILANIL